MKTRSLRAFLAALFLIFCMGSSIFISNIPMSPMKKYSTDQDLRNNSNGILHAEPAGNPGQGIDYKSNAGTNLILQNIIDSVLGIVETSPTNADQTIKISLSFGPIQFEILVKISWSDNAITHVKVITVEFEALDTNPLTFSGGFEILGKLIGAPNCRIPGLSLQAKYTPSFGGALEFRYDGLSKTVKDVQILNDWQIKYDVEISGALSKALVTVLSTPAASMYEGIDKLLPSGAKLSDIALVGGSLSFQMQTSSLDAMTYFTIGGNISTNASISGKEVLRASIAPSISLKWGKDQGGSYYQPTGKISADVKLDFCSLTYLKTWDIINWQNNKTYDVVRIKAPVFQISPQAVHKADTLYLSTTLESELEGPIITQIVSFEYFDATWQTFTSATTQFNGKANGSWEVTLDPGSYPVRAKYTGTSRFQACYSEDTTLFVEETTTKLVAPTYNNNITYLRRGENLTCSINLTTEADIPIESEVVRFYYSADRNSTWTELGYNSTGSNGLAYFSTPFSPTAGVYYLVAMFGGSTQYQKCSESLYHEIKVVQNGSLIISPEPLQGLKVERGVNKTYLLHVENLDPSTHLCNFTFNASGSSWFTPNATSANISAQSGYNFRVNVSIPSGATIQIYTGNFTIYLDNVFYRNFSYQFEVSDYQTSANFSHPSQTLDGSSSNSIPFGDLSAAQKTLYSTCLNEILVNVTFSGSAPALIGQTMTGYFRVGSTDYGMYLQHGSGIIASGYNEFWYYLKAGDSNLTCRSNLPGNTEGVSLPISGGSGSVSATIQLYYRTESLVKVTSFFDGGISNLTVNRGDDIKINWRAQGDYQQVLFASLLAQHPTEFAYKSGTFGVDPATAQSLGNLSYGTVNNSYTIFTCNTAGTYHIPWTTVMYSAFLDDIRTAYVHTSYSGALTVKVVGSITGQVSFAPAATVTEDEEIEIKYYARDDNSLEAIEGLLIFINITQPDATNVTYIMDPIAGSPGWYHVLYKPDQDGTYTYFILAKNDAYSLDTKSGSFSVTGKLEMGAHTEMQDQRALEFTTGDQIAVEIFAWHDGVLETPAGTFAATLKYPSTTTSGITVSNVGTGRYQAVINLTLFFDQYDLTPELGWYEVNFTHSGAGWVTQSNSTFFYVRPPQIFIERTRFQVILTQQDFLLNYTVQPSLVIPTVQVSLDNTSKGNLPSPVIFYNLTEGWHVLSLSVADQFDFTTNQSVSLYVTPKLGQKTMTLFEEDFEHGLSGWNTTGLWHLTSNLSNADPFFSPVHSAWCGREDTGTYNTGSQVRDNLTSPVIDLTRLTNAILRFSTRYNVETGTGYDTATVLVSTNSIDYVSVYSRSSPNQLPTWTDITVDLGAYVGKNIRIRFMFDTVNTAANDYQGWLIDNVRVTTKNWQGASLLTVKVGALTAYGSTNPITQYPGAVSLINGRQGSATEIAQPLNLSLLQQYSIIWIDENGSSMPRADLEALMTWVYQGGSIISSGDNFGTMSDVLNYLNISTVSSAATGGNYSNFTIHDVTEGLTTIYHQNPGCSLNLSLYPYRNEIFPIVVQDGYVQGAAGWYGNGKFVITADEDPFLNSGTQQNALYINKIFGWLSNLTMPRDLLPPSACLVAVNPDPGIEGNFHINATLFDRSGISSAIARVRSLCNNETIVALYDDGFHGDGIANDSQYGGNYTTNSDDVGMRYLDLEIVDNSTAANVLNISSITTFIVQPGIPRIHEISQNSTFEYIAGGTAYQLSDDGYLQFTLPFAFPFYNNTFSTIYVSNNGWMSFTTTDPSESINVAFPSSNSRYVYAIAPYWNDIAATTTYGSIYAANLTLPGNHHAWVVSWQDVYHAGAGSCGTFQAILYESGEIKVQFLEMNNVLANGGYTCGLNLGSNSYACTYSGLVDGTNHTAILFVPIKETTTPASISDLVAAPTSWTNSSSFNVSWSNPWDYCYIGGAYYKLDSAPTSNDDGTLVTGYDLTEIIGINAGSTGTHVLYVWVVDQANNTDYTTYVSTDLYYDGIAPTNPSGCVQENGTTTSGVWQNSVSDANFTWSGATDADSGVAGYLYYWGTDPAGMSSSYTTSAGYDAANASGSGIYYLRVQTNDTAGNLAAWITLYELWYDCTPPTNPMGCVQENGTTTSGVWQNSVSDANFTWSGATDADSGVAGYFYYWGTDPAGTSSSYTTLAAYDPTNASGSDIYYLRVQTNDSVGNLASWITLYELWYDCTPPTNPTVCDQTTDPTTSGVWQNYENDPAFTWSGATDADSGVAGYYYYWGEDSGGTSSSYQTAAAFNPSQLGSSGTYYLRVQTNDTAGNLATWVTIYEFKFDIIPPNNPGIFSGTQVNGTTWSGVWQNATNDANFTWSGATDTHSGVAGYYWYWGPVSDGTSPLLPSYYTTTANLDPSAISTGIYYLRVRTNDTAGNLAASWVSLYEFRYDGIAPTNPSDCEQVNGTTTSGVWQNSTSDPDFTWSGAVDDDSGVAGYYYYWGTSSSGTSSSYTTSTAYDPAVVVGSGVYYLRVQTNDSVGNLAAWITIYELWYDGTAPTNPSVCNQIGDPTTSGVWQNVENQPIFAWSGDYDAHSGVAGYYYYWGTSSAGTSSSYTVSTSYSPTVSSGIYFLRVLTRDAAGNNATWVTLYEFRYDGTAPNNPTGCTQTNGSTTSGEWQNTTSDPNFTWSGASDAHSGVAGYYYYWGTESGGTSSSYTTAAAYDPVAIVESDIYYLRVLTNDSVGNLASLWVTLYEFRYDITPPNNPDPFGCDQPGTTSGQWQHTVSDPAFTWNAGTDSDSGVAGYYIYWGTDPAGTSADYQTGTSYNPDAVTSGIYYLRVQTNDSVGNLAAWSTIYEFRYDATPPDNPTGCTQTVGSTTSGVWQNTVNHPLFTLIGASDGQSGIAWFYYYLGTDPAGTSTVDYTISTDCDPGAVPSGIYYFRVRTRDAAGNMADWVTLYELWYDGTPPTNPTVCLQTNGTTTSGTWQKTVSDANFTWSGASDAHTGVAGYLYYWGTSATGTSTSYTTSTSFDPEAVGRGTYYLRVRANDTLGNLASNWVTLYVFMYDADWVPPTPEEPPLDLTLYLVIILVITAVITVIVLVARRPKTLPSQGRKLEEIAAKRLKAQEKKAPPETDRGRALFQATREPIPTPGQPLPQPLPQPRPQPTAVAPQPESPATPTVEEDSKPITEEGPFVAAFAASCLFCGEAIQEGKCAFCGAWICQHCGTTNTPAIDKCAKCEKGRWG